jgi:hypothetical protein
MMAAISTADFRSKDIAAELLGSQTERPSEQGIATEHMSAANKTPNRKGGMPLKPSSQLALAKTRQAEQAKAREAKALATAQEKIRDEGHCGGTLRIRPPLEIIFEAVEERGKPLTPSSLACTDRMIHALAGLHTDKDGRHIALETIASVSMRIIGDAELLTRRIAERRLQSHAWLYVLHELSNLAAIFAHNQTFEDIYDTVCTAMENLRTVATVASQP